VTKEAAHAGCLFVIPSRADGNGSLHSNNARTTLTNVVAASLVSRRSAGVVALGQHGATRHGGPALRWLQHRALVMSSTQRATQSIFRARQFCEAPRSTNHCF